MEHVDVMEKLLDECDKATDVLMALNPHHEHLQYDFTNKSDAETERLTALFYQNFGPKGVSFHPLEDRVKERSWSNYLTEVKAAIFIEKTKIGFRKQP